MQFYPPKTLSTAVALCLSLLFSCTSDIELPPPPGNSSEQGGNSSTDSSSSGAGSSSSFSSSSAPVGSSSSSGGGDVPVAGCPDAVTNSNSVTCGGKTYATVEIGGKIWMKENLKYNVVGSKCGDESTNTLKDENTLACDTYGRLYDWSTAMALPSKCNSTFSTDDADCAIRTTNHRGICPSGWHIPSNAEWDALYRSADGTSGTSSPYESPTAGKHLKAKEGWNNCGPSGSGKANLCEDTKGFSALPGGLGAFYDDFISAGDRGGWWSASEDNSRLAYGRSMDYDSEGTDTYGFLKSFWHSVRCLQD